MNAFARVAADGLVVLALAAGQLACGSRARTTPAPQSIVRPVAGAPVARIGNEVVTAEEVQTIARAEGISDPRAAVERAIELHLLAREAMRRGFDRDPLVVDLARRAAVQSLLAHTVETEYRIDNLPASDLRAGMRLRGFELAHG